MSEPWRYYAAYGIPRGRNEPRGLFRTRIGEDGLHDDQALRRDGTWKQTSALSLLRLHMEEQDYVEISEEEAEWLKEELLRRPLPRRGPA